MDLLSLIIKHKLPVNILTFKAITITGSYCLLLESIPVVVGKLPADTELIG